MILEQLQTIHSFGCGLKSTVTPHDIAAKEKELGFPLPEALRELYLIFHPDDPLFSDEMHLIPLSLLQTCQRTCWSDTILTLLPFCRGEKYGYAFEVSRHIKKTPCPQGCPADDPEIFGLFVSPETAKEKKYLNGYEVPCNKARLSQWLVEWLSYEQTRAQPSVVSVNKDKVPHYSNLQEIIPHHFYEIPKEELAKARYNFVTRYTEEPSRILYGTILYACTGYVGAQSDEELEDLMKQLGFRYTWIKSQTGHPVYNAAPPEPPKERELLSITPVLEFLREFTGITSTGAKEESIQRVETRLEAPLPLPMAEFYRCLPSSFYHSYNTIRPLSSLKKAKDGKLNFLEENQAVYHWAAELNSPFVYRCGNDSVSEWIPCGIIDGFLAAEFLWALACDEDLDLNLWEFPDFEPDMLKPGGKLAAHLFPIANITEQIAAGNTRRLYQTANAQAVGLYNRLEETFWFVTKDEETEELLFGILSDT